MNLIGKVIKMQVRCLLCQHMALSEGFMDVLSPHKMAEIGPGRVPKCWFLDGCIFKDMNYHFDTESIHMNEKDIILNIIIQSFTSVHRINTKTESGLP